MNSIPLRNTNLTVILFLKHGNLYRLYILFVAVTLAIHYFRISTFALRLYLPTKYKIIFVASAI